jgi:uncharacterized membrane protein
MVGYLTGGNVVVRVGIIVLFFGVAFLLKYAADRGRLPIEIRLIGVTLGAIALLMGGWRLRRRNENYGLALQGGGIGLLYLTVFAALRLYDLIPAGFAFALLVAIAALSVVLALLQDSRTFAVLGTAGGFLAPVLASTGAGSHVALFSYYALLNAVILAIAWFKAWRSLNLVGFVFTFVIGASWGYGYYRPEQFATTEPFLLLFFLFYTAIAVLFALRQPVELRGYVDGTLVFGTPLIAFALQAAMVRTYPFGLAWSAFGFAAFYLALAWALLLQGRARLRLLIEAFLATGVVFATLAVPLALDGQWTAAVWALEGAALVWVGVRQDRGLARAFGALLQLSAGLRFLINLPYPPDALPVLNGVYLGGLVVSLAGLFSAFYPWRHRERLCPQEIAVAGVLFAWGLLWWFGMGLNEIDRYLSDRYTMGAVLSFFAASCAIAAYLERGLTWPWLRYPAFGLLPVLFVLAYIAADALPHPFARVGWFGWPLALAAHYFIVYRFDREDTPYLRFLHAGALWLIALIMAWEFHWAIDHWVQGAGTWPLIAWALAPMLVILVIAGLGRRFAWPVKRHWTLYLSLGLAPVAAFLWLWIWVVNLSSRGDPWPLSYLPVLNPLDVMTGLALAALLYWGLQRRALRQEGWSRPLRRGLSASLAVTAFLWLNAILVRTVHYWGDVPFTAPAMFQSMVLQASLSLFWSLLALLLMVFATRQGLRPLWMVGAGLLAVVVVKLFVIDLSSAGTVERIVSFLGVGILLLIIGYLSPVPPREQREVPSP